MDHENDLPLTGSHWGTYRAKIKNGKIEKLLGWEHDTDPSPIGSGILDIHNNSIKSSIIFLLIIILIHNEMHLNKLEEK